MSPLKLHQTKILTLLTRQELLVAEIYRFFAGLFPDLREFWNDMAKEEMEHATWMEYFHNKAENGEVAFLDSNIKTYTVESFVKYLEDALSKIKDKAPTHKAAFATAQGIENSLLVKNLFNNFDSSDKELSRLLQTLRDKMNDHRRRIQVQAVPFGGPIKTSP